MVSRKTTSNYYYTFSLESINQFKINVKKSTKNVNFVVDIIDIYTPIDIHIPSTQFEQTSEHKRNNIEF